MSVAAVDIIAEKLVTQILDGRLRALSIHRGDEAKLRAAFGDLGLSDDSLRRLRDLLQEK